MNVQLGMGMAFLKFFIVIFLFFILLLFFLAFSRFLANVHQRKIHKIFFAAIESFRLEPL